MTNKYLPAENMCGGHAVWLTFNLDQILTLFGPSRECPPFWDYDPAIHALRVGSHLMIPTNGLVVFYNPGHYFARDANQNVVFEGGRPKLLPHPFPLTKGFVEAEFQPSVDLFDPGLRIPKRAELKYWTPLKDETKPDGVRMVMLSKLTVESRSLDSQPIPESTFSPAWTNTFAVVVDFRASVTGATGEEPLNYLTKSNRINPGKFDLMERKLVGIVYGQSYPIQITAPTHQQSMQGCEGNSYGAL